MLRRVAAVAGVALGLLAPAAARAQILTSDPATHALQSLQQTQLVEQVANGLKELAQLQAQLQQLEISYQAIAHITDMGQAVGQLRSLLAQNPLPLDPAAVESALRGGGSAGFTSILSSLFNANLAQNRIFTPQDDTLGSQELRDQLNSLSASQAVGDSLYQAAGNRIPMIQQLGDRINNAGTEKDTLDLIARLSTEQNIATSQATQAIAASIMTNQARDQEALKAEQLQLQSDQAWLAEARAQTGDW